MQFIKGNILECNAEALVNTVNTVGVMGKGIALQFKERYPNNYGLYVQACKRNEVKVGKMFITTTDSIINPKWVINFPTKIHWIQKSSYAIIESGLDDLIVQINQLGITSIAIPPLGAGQGGLDWEKVKQIIETKLGHLNIEILIFEPINLAKESIGSVKTNLTKARAMVLSLINQYRKLGFDISLLEIQKLAYFLQRMGQNDLKLSYKQYLYGPYAHNLQHLLHELEKGYISSDKSILDSKPLDLIYLNLENLSEISNFVKTKCTIDEQTRLEKISNLMAGYESPFGLELLATVDWILNENTSVSLNEAQIKAKIGDWSKQKDDKFTLEHVRSAKNRLHKFDADLLYV